MANELTIGGRKFRAIDNSTIEQDFFTATHVQAAGLDRITMEDDETAEHFAARVFEQGMASGRVFKMLSGMLIPAEMKDVDWTPEVAADTEMFLRNVTDPEGKAVIRANVANMLAGFTQAGLLSFRTSLKSSSSPAAAHSRESVG